MAWFSQSLSVSQPGAMEPWLKISLLLCAVGFFKGMVPSDHYIFQYLTEFRHVPGEMVTNSYFPQYSYWAAGFLLIFLLTTDVLRYKPVIIISALAGVAHYITLRWTQGVESLIVSVDGELIVQYLFSSAIFKSLFQVTTFSAGVALASDIAYFTYIYAKVDRNRYQQVTSNTRSAALFGRCIGAVMSQYFVQYNIMDSQELIYISLASE